MIAAKSILSIHVIKPIGELKNDTLGLILCKALALVEVQLRYKVAIR